MERTSVEFFAAGREIIGKVARSNAIVKRWRIGGHADNNRWLASIETRWAGFMGKSGDTWRAASDRQSASQLRDRDRWSRRAGRRRGGRGNGGGNNGEEKTIIRSTGCPQRGRKKLNFVRGLLIRNPVSCVRYIFMWAVTGIAIVIYSIVPALNIQTGETDAMWIVIVLSRWIFPLALTFLQSSAPGQSFPSNRALRVEERMIWGNYRGIQRALSRKPVFRILGKHLRLSLTFKIVFLILLETLSRT